MKLVFRKLYDKNILSSNTDFLDCKIVKEFLQFHSVIRNKNLAMLKKRYFSLKKKIISTLSNMKSILRI